MKGKNGKYQQRNRCYQKKKNDASDKHNRRSNSDLGGLNRRDEMKEDKN